jgi:hypothetical protein
MKESIYDKMTNAEREVASVLKKMSIKWKYEQPIFVWDDNDRPRVWAPDFYLVTFGIYVEVCGSKNFDYEYRRKIFEKNGYKVIFLHLFKDRDLWLNYFLSYMRKNLRNANEKFIESCKKNNIKRLKFISL